MVNNKLREGGGDRKYTRSDSSASSSYSRTIGDKRLGGGKHRQRTGVTDATTAINAVVSAGAVGRGGHDAVLLTAAF
jgi:hypothetical protein